MNVIFIGVINVIILYLCCFFAYWPARIMSSLVPAILIIGLTGWFFSLVVILLESYKL
jgi:hypothetical protein